MSSDDSDLTVRPGRIGDGGAASGRRSQKLAAQVRRAAARAGHMRRKPGPGRVGTGRFGRGRNAALRARFARDRRRVVIKQGSSAITAVAFAPRPWRGTSDISSVTG